MARPKVPTASNSGFNPSGFGLPPKEKKSPVNMPIDITNGLENLSDFNLIPCDILVEYNKKDEYDTVDTESEEFMSLVTSIREKGVIEPITVRPIPGDRTRYEVLDGHHRWQAAIRAGKEKIPAKVWRDCDDDLAEYIYRITTLLRKEQTIRARANGWWLFFKTTRYQTDEQRQRLVEEGIISEEMLHEATKSKRMLYQYAKLHELISPMMDKVEKKQIAIRNAIQIASLTPEHQEDLINYVPYLKNLTKVRRLRDLAEGRIEGRKWDKAAIEAILLPDPLPSETRAKKEDAESLVKSIKECIPKHLQDDTLDVVQKALELYFETYPEKYNPQQ